MARLVRRNWIRTRRRASARMDRSMIKTPIRTKLISPKDEMPMPHVMTRTEPMSGRDGFSS